MRLEFRWGLVAIALFHFSCDTASDADGPEPQLEEPSTVADIDDPWLRPGQVEAWTGDLDGMLERGVVRVLTVPNRTHYFVDGARERGLVAEEARAFEEQLNKGRSNLERVDVVVIPMRRDQLLPNLVRGRGDVAIGNLTITPERLETVDFSPPLMKDVRELVVLAPGAELIETLEDLSGRQVWVRRSSSYYESLEPEPASRIRRLGARRPPPRGREPGG